MKNRRKPWKTLGKMTFWPKKIVFLDFGFSGARKLLTLAAFWISDFEEGGAAELGGGALLQSEIDRGTDREWIENEPRTDRERFQ